MVLTKRSASWAGWLLKGASGTLVAFGVALKFADYRSCEVDREFLWRGMDAENDAARIRAELKHAGYSQEDVRDIARARMKQIVNNGDRPPAHLTDEKGGDVGEFARPTTLPRTASAAVELDTVQCHTGDICLFMGTGAMSWKITRLGYIFSAFNTDALRYSHVGMVVAPLPDDCLQAMAALKGGGCSAKHTATAAPWWDVFGLFGRGASAVSLGGGDSPTPMLDALHEASKDGTPLVIEAIDNKDCNARNVLPDPDALLHDQVMVSRLEDRAFGVDLREAAPRWCYSRLALRHVTGIEWTPERVREFEAWLAESVRRPMDKKPTLPLAMADPRLHSRSDPRIISCSELVADGLRALGMIDKVPLHRWREHGKGKLLPSVMYAPMHFTTLGQRWCDWGYLALRDDATMRVEPEQRVLMTRTLQPPPEEPSLDRYWPKAVAVTD